MRYEYKVVIQRTNPALHESFLRHLGTQGWELTEVMRYNESPQVDSYAFYLKREAK